MEKKFLYFQPEYVSKFKCDSSRCNDNCCARPWEIIIDSDTYQKYSRLGFQEIFRHIQFNKELGEYILVGRPCPMLTEKKLCRIQLEHGENFLSLVCRTYPRVLTNCSKFFELSLSLTCPLAAEMILFEREPLAFELKEIVEDDANDIGLSTMRVPEKFVAHMIDIQIAMLSILQERRLTLDQRLIVLGFFLDKLDEISAGELDVDALTKLIAAYESKKFFAEQVPLMLASVRFDTKNFIGLMLKIFNVLYSNVNMEDKQSVLDDVADALQIKLDENNFVDVATVTANYERLADARKNFTARYSTLLENYLVNEIFLNVYPWRFADTIANNYAVFVMMFKVFELILFSATLKGFDSRDDLLKLIGFFAAQIDHGEYFREKFLTCAKESGDTFTLMESLLQSQAV